MVTTQAKSFLAAHAKSIGRLRTIIIVTRVVVSVLTIPTPSYALGTAEERAACTPDVFRLCSSEIPSVSGVIACMKAKRGELSPACKVVVDRHLGVQSNQNPQVAP